MEESKEKEARPISKDSYSSKLSRDWKLSRINSPLGVPTWRSAEGRPRKQETIVRKTVVSKKEVYSKLQAEEQACKWL